MARKKRLTPKDKRIQELQAELNMAQCELRRETQRKETWEKQSDENMKSAVGYMKERDAAKQRMDTTIERLRSLLGHADHKDEMPAERKLGRLEGGIDSIIAANRYLMVLPRA